MKKIYSIISLFIITFMFIGVLNVKAETTYKKYNIGEVITAQVDKKGNKGTFIVLEDSSTTSDEVVVIQKNGGLDQTLKALNIKYTDNNTEHTVTKLAVTNATIRTEITYGEGQTHNVLTNIENDFNGYIRTGEGKKFGLMTVNDFETKYKANADKIFSGQNYWLRGDAANSESLNFVDGDIKTVNSTNNSYDILNADGTLSHSYSLPKYDRLINGSYLSTALTGNDLLTEYEPAIIITLCKTAITIPNTPNPDTSDMNIILLSTIGILSLGVIVLSTKRLISIK